MRSAALARQHTAAARPATHLRAPAPRRHAQPTKHTWISVADAGSRSPQLKAKRTNESKIIAKEARHPDAKRANCVQHAPLPDVGACCRVRVRVRVRASMRDATLLHCRWGRCCVRKRRRWRASRQDFWRPCPPVIASNANLRSIGNYYRDMAHSPAGAPSGQTCAARSPQPRQRPGGVRASSIRLQCSPARLSLAHTRRHHFCVRACPPTQVEHVIRTKNEIHGLEVCPRTDAPCPRHPL